MTSLRDQTGTFEIILAALAAAGLVLMVNMFASAVVAVLLFLVITWQAANPVAGIAAAGIAIICIALNLAHKYIYQIKDENYGANQVRLMILLALVGVFVMAEL
jgi:hypothetical protein